MARWAFLLGMGGVGAIASSAAVVWAVESAQLEMAGLTAQAEVVRNVMSTSIDDDGYTTTYYTPEFTFSDGSGEHLVMGQVGSSPASYSVGASVPVIYFSGDPDSAVIHSFEEMWLASVAVGIFGVFFLIGGISGFKVFSDPFFTKQGQAEHLARFEKARWSHRLDGPDAVTIEAIVTELSGSIHDGFVITCERDGRSYTSKPVFLDPGDVVGKVVEVVVVPDDKQLYDVKVNALLS